MRRRVREEREAGQTELVLRVQTEAIAEAAGDERDNLVLAYEPVWAIGTGRTATPDIAQEAHVFIKSILDVPVLYGGSVKPEKRVSTLRAGGRRRSARRRCVPRTRLLRRDLPPVFPLVVLVILDGWGVAPPGPGNAVDLAVTPVFDRL